VKNKDLTGHGNWNKITTRTTSMAGEGWKRGKSDSHALEIQQVKERRIELNHNLRKNDRQSCRCRGSSNAHRNTSEGEVGGSETGHTKSKRLQRHLKGGDIR